MSGSNWQTYYAPQIEARNRVLQSKNAGAHHQTPRTPRVPGTVRRGLHMAHGRAIAAAATAVAILLAFFVVFLVQASPASSQTPPAGHTVSSTAHGGGGTHPRML